MKNRIKFNARKNSAMFTYKHIEYMLDRDGAGVYTRTSMNRSPKKAVSLDDYTSKLEGVDGTPIMFREILMRGSKVIFDRWN